MSPLVSGTKRMIAVIDGFTETSGQAIAWLTLAIMTITCTVVVMRYLVGGNAIALQESVIYLHATVFMLGAAFTLKRGGHVRVDILYRALSTRSRALIDVLGGLLFLIPVCGLIFWLSWDYVMNSWAAREASGESTGLPWVYALKTLMLMMPATLLVQGIAEILRNLLLLLPGAEQGAKP
ncbi:MAG: TRAP transporter small permease subunit [Porticoccaceae bacterium]